jgi:colanic acid biosynthesis glycosyl transferase WcaI
LTDEADCGVCVEPENGEALAEAVLRLQAEPSRARAMGKNGRSYVERHFARPAITQRYRLALESLIEQSPLTAAGQASLSSGSS